jgi:AcrR family transcriptional regulator
MTTSTPPDPRPDLPPAPRRAVRRRQGAGRPSTLTVEAVVAAAIELLDEAGVEELSMRRVAEHLGTGAASLYAYVAGKDELMSLVFDELVGRVALPEPDGKHWREQIQRLLAEFHDQLVAHRGTALTGLGRIPTTPNTLRATDTLMAIMRAGGLSDRVVGLGLDTLMLYLCADAFEDGLLESSGMSTAEIGQYYRDVHDFYSALPATRYPALAQVAPQMVDPDVDRFAFGLSVILAGLEAVSRQG